MKPARFYCRRRSRLWATTVIVLSLSSAVISKGETTPWQSTVTKDPPGNFPELRPLRAHYHFGWSGITAATAEVRFTKTAGNRFQLEGTGRTTGLARVLWKLDLTYRALATSDTLRPIEVKQVEAYRRKTMTTQLTFAGNTVTRRRIENPSPAKPGKTRQFTFPNLFDLHAAMLYLRSQPLTNRSTYRVVVYPTSTPYLATLTVLGREKIAVDAGRFDAIKFNVQLKKIGKNLELEPHRKFKRATVWVSDDSERLILRIEAQIFVGTVFAELQSVQFDNPRP
jgi:hypothetical protein